MNIPRVPQTQHPSLTSFSSLSYKQNKLLCFHFSVHAVNSTLSTPTSVSQASSDIFYEAFPNQPSQHVSFLSPF